MPNHRMSTGAVIATLVHPFTRMGPVSDVGVRIGMGLTVMSVGILAGPPISGAIVDATGSFRNVGYFAGKPEFSLRRMVADDLMWY